MNYADEIVALVPMNKSMSLVAVIDRLKITRSEFVAYMEDRKNQLIAQASRDRAREGMRAGSGISKRVLGPDGWIVADSMGNMRTALDVHQDQERTAAEEAAIQAEVNGDRMEHELSIVCRELEVFTLTRRILIGVPGAHAALTGESREVQIGVAARIQATALK